MLHWFKTNSTKLNHERLFVRRIWAIYLLCNIIYVYLLWDEPVDFWRFWVLLGLFLLVEIINLIMIFKMGDTKRFEFHYLQYVDLFVVLAILGLTDFEIQATFLLYRSVMLATMNYGTKNGFRYAVIVSIGYAITYSLFGPERFTMYGYGNMLFSALSFLTLVCVCRIVNSWQKIVEKDNVKLTRTNSELFVLQQISNHVTSVLNISDLLKLIPDILIGISGAKYAAIYLSEDGSFASLKIKATNCQDKNIIRELFLGVCGYRIRNTFTTGNPTIENYITCGEFGSMMNIPIKHKDELLGVVVLTHYRSNAFSEENLKLLTHVANQLAIAIANARLYDQVKKLANLDGLTGVYNRKYFQDYLTGLFKDQSIEDVTIIMLDVDHFKNINDTFGHLMGDQVLKTIAEILKQNIGSDGLLARYGGEEFVVLLPGKNIEASYHLGQELCKIVSEQRIFYQDHVCKVTVSLGVAGKSMPYVGSMDDLLNAADAALYMAKKYGRNCCVRADECLQKKELTIV